MQQPKPSGGWADRESNPDRGIKDRPCWWQEAGKCAYRPDRVVVVCRQWARVCTDLRTRCGPVWRRLLRVWRYRRSSTVVNPLHARLGGVEERTGEEDELVMRRTSRASSTSGRRTYSTASFPAGRRAPVPWPLTLPVTWCRPRRRGRPRRPRSGRRLDPAGRGSLRGCLAVRSSPCWRRSGLTAARSFSADTPCAEPLAGGPQERRDG